jgi:hypothetical protein
MFHITGGIILAFLILRNLDAIIVLTALAFDVFVLLIGGGIIVWLTITWAIYLPRQFIIVVGGGMALLALAVWWERAHINHQKRRRQARALEIWRDDWPGSPRLETEEEARAREERWSARDEAQYRAKVEARLARARGGHA